MTAAVGLAESKRVAAVVWIVSLQDRFGDILSYSLLQSLENTTHVPTNAVAQELVDDVAMMKSR